MIGSTVPVMFNLEQEGLVSEPSLQDGHAMIGFLWTGSVVLKLAHGPAHHVLIKTCDHTHQGITLHCTVQTLQKQKTRLTKKINFFHKKVKENA